jgi:G6PDH family F420-dependent oxidoreductase
LFGADPGPPRVRIGYWLSSEEHSAPQLVANAVAAEDAGFETAMLSDHFHPWVPRQGQSPFAWSVLGAIAQVTTRLEIGTGVSAAVHRQHPTLLAQAAATVATLMPGRFLLGLGTGERLNEQITGERWPRPSERRTMLEEAVTIIRRLWDGENLNYDGTHFRVEHAQLFSLPVDPPPIVIAASGPRSAKLAAELGDGLLSVTPDPRIVETFEANGGAGKRRAAQLHVCVAEDEDEARRVARQWWPQGPLPGSVLSELAQPREFEALAEVVDDDAVADAVVCGPDPKRHLQALRRYVGAGFESIYVHQIGPQQEEFLRFYSDEVLPEL